MIPDWIERVFDGSLVQGGVFLAIGVVGAILLLLSIVLDGIFDGIFGGVFSVFEGSDGPLSLTTIAAFTSVFGFSAFAMVGAGASTSVAGVVGAVAGVAGGAIAWWLSRLIRSAESNTSVSSDDLVGVEGSVVLAIPQGGLGEVALIMHGERVSLSATSNIENTAIPRGARVRVIRTLTATSVTVEPVEAPELSA